MREGWLEIVKKKEEFQRILQLLLDFDERTGRWKRVSDPASHYFRRAAAAVSPENLRIVVKTLGESVFQVALRIDSQSGHGVTGYIHEDGIYQERKGAAVNHPVFGITCLTDLAEAAAPIDVESLGGCLREFLENSSEGTLSGGK